MGSQKASKPQARNVQAAYVVLVKEGDESRRSAELERYGYSVRVVGWGLGTEAVVDG